MLLTAIFLSHSLEASDVRSGFSKKEQRKSEMRPDANGSLMKAQKLFARLKSLSDSFGEIEMARGCRILDLEEISDLQLYGERKPFSGFRFRLEKGTRIGSWFWGRSEDLYLYPDQEIMDHRLIRKEVLSKDQRALTQYDYESIDLYEIGRSGTEIQKKKRVRLVFDENHQLVHILFEGFQRRYGENDWSKTRQISCRSPY
jgi:hypothetical protein